MVSQMGYHRLGSVFPRAMLRKTYPQSPRTSGRVAFLVSAPVGGNYTMVVSPGVFVLTFLRASIYEGFPEHAEYFVEAMQPGCEVVTLALHGVSMTMADDVGCDVTFGEVAEVDHAPVSPPSENGSFGVVCGTDTTYLSELPLVTTWMSSVWSESTYCEQLAYSQESIVEYERPAQRNRSESYAIVAQ